MTTLGEHVHGLQSDVYDRNQVHNEYRQRRGFLLKTVSNIAIVIFGNWNHHIFENRVQPQRGKTEWLAQVERIYILEQLFF